MARPRRSYDPDRDPGDDDDREYRPPSKRSANIVIAVLVALGLLLIAYFVLELSPADLGGMGALLVVGLVGIVVARGRLLR
jgi:hypothetical protein